MHLHQCCSSQDELWPINPHMFLTTVNLMWVPGASHRIWMPGEFVGNELISSLGQIWDTWTSKGKKNGSELKGQREIWASRQLYGSFLCALGESSCCFYGQLLWDTVVSVRIRPWFMPAWSGLPLFFSWRLPRGSWAWLWRGRLVVLSLFCRATADKHMLGMQCARQRAQQEHIVNDPSVAVTLSRRMIICIAKWLVSQFFFALCVFVPLSQL